MPDYGKAFASEKGRRILQVLAQRGGVANFSEIEKDSGIKGSTLTYQLDILCSFGVIEREVKGTYRLAYRTPLCYVFETNTPFAYLGLLGRRESRAEPETSVALRLLEKEDIKPELTYVVTSLEALNQWKDLKLPY
jgi:DNA-binding transcriptional ArsR family regulator